MTQHHREVEPVSTNLRHTAEEAAAVVAALGELEPDLDRAAGLLIGALRNGGKALACGNGGSAADAAHFTTELVVRFEADRAGLPAVSLSSHGGDLTAIGNDLDFERVFARQVEALGRPGDVLLAMSTSGQSPNVVAGLRRAKELGLATIALLGRDGGACQGLADVELIVAHPRTARVQEAHQVLLHALCGAVDRAFASKG
ncbi:MAG: SIS domain-containing protein [Planctomycetota bacterium]